MLETMEISSNSQLARMVNVIVNAEKTMKISETRNN